MRLLIITTFLTVFAILVRGTLPRYRIDQAITLHWKVIALYLLLFYLETIIVFYLFTL